MPLPSFNSSGDLPPGIYSATIEEVVERFGSSTPQRQIVTARLRRLHGLARATGKVRRFLIFGSYVTEKSAPNDVDVVLVMEDDFRSATCDPESRPLFDHQRADREFGASIFWIRPALLIAETLEEFVRHWQIKRDQGLRGIVEVIE